MCGMVRVKRLVDRLFVEDRLQANGDENEDDADDDNGT